MATMACMSSGLHARGKARSALAAENPGLWFSSDAYPVAALRAGESGRVVAELSLDETGKVAGCAVKVSSGSATLDAATCDLALAKARYLPARDEAGTPIKSTVTLPVRWTLPENVPVKPSTFSLTVSVELSPAGDMLSCASKVTGSSAEPIGDVCGIPPAIEQSLSMMPTLVGRHAMITLQSAWTVDSSPPPVEAHRAAGQVVGAVARARVEIDPDGTVTRCTAIEEDLPPGASSICKLRAGMFAPDPGKPHQVIMFTAISGRVLP